MSNKLTVGGSGGEFVVGDSEPLDVQRRHRVGRVLSFFYSRRNWESPTPHPGDCAPHPLVQEGGGAHSLAGVGFGESQFRRGDIHCGTLYV